MEVIDKEDLACTEVQVTCSFCGEDTVMIVRHIEVGQYVQTISEMELCCDKVKDEVNRRSAGIGVSRN